MKKILETILGIISKLILKRYDPKIIAVTGSVGKTSTKEAIYSVLRHRFVTRQSDKNYNNEIGVPLTIIGKSSQGKSLAGWIGVVLYAARLIIKRDNDYPTLIVMEVAADRPGDISYLRTLFTPEIVVITSISGVHLEAFGTIEKILNEKLALAEGLSNSSPIFINGDNKYLSKEKESNKNVHYVTYGFSESDITGFDDRLITDKKNRYRVLGLETKVRLEREEGRLFLPGVISHSHVYSALAAVGVGRALGIPLEVIVEYLKGYHVPAGRMKLLPGIKQTLLIDDSYNSSPIAVDAALVSMMRLPKYKTTKIWIVLGDMLELGKDSKSMHREIGKHISDHEYDYLICVGHLAKDIATGALDAGMLEDHVFTFDTTEIAGRFLQDRMQKRDIILIKGSQGARMEKVVKEVMGDPLRAKELLVRQDASWLGR
jgi:UDP-N-acetylmuramoyl-tripeptide--D-alanyl-D-alanine ligase